MQDAEMRHQLQDETRRKVYAQVTKNWVVTNQPAVCISRLEIPMNTASLMRTAKDVDTDMHYWSDYCSDICGPEESYQVLDCNDLMYNIDSLCKISHFNKMNRVNRF
jgi:hypothetical protein